jgi:NAD(P)-dependent dehydrogenase (short-subunit alcohol dehydrogenase family)
VAVRFIPIDVTNVRTMDAGVGAFGCGSDLIVWTVGSWMPGSLLAMADSGIDDCIQVHFRGLISFLRAYLKRYAEPFSLVIVASASSWRLTPDSAIYCAAKAAQAALARNFAFELSHKRPGSKVLIVNPAGVGTRTMATLLKRDVSQMLDPAEVARIVLDLVIRQSCILEEVQILRGASAGRGVQAVLRFGAAVPELYETSAREA